MLLEGEFDLVSEAIRQRSVVDEECVFSRSNNAVALRAVGDGGHDEVDVRVVLHLPPPGVEHGGG